RMGEALRRALGRRRRFGLRGIVHAEGFRSLWIDFTIICRTPAHPEDEVTSVSGGSCREVVTFGRIGGQVEGAPTGGGRLVDAAEAGEQMRPQHPGRL